MPELDVARYSLQIDPRLHIWGWEVVAYLFLGGMAAGTMILGPLLARRGEPLSPAARWLGFAAPLLVSVGMGALFLDLEYKQHVWRFYLAFRWTSPMSWGSWILLLVYPVSLLSALSMLDEAQSGRLEALAARLRLGAGYAWVRRTALAHGPRLHWASLGLGIALGIYTGILLSTLGARALWASALLGPLFLASGLSTGAALALLLPLAPRERRFLARWDLLAMGLEVLCLALFLAGLATGGDAARQAARLLLGGAWTAPFWSLVILGGLLLPALLALLDRRHQGCVAPALVLLGGLSLRWILVAAGQG